MNLRMTTMQTMKVAVIAVLAGMVSPSWAETVRMEVNGMVCAFCAQGIEKRLRSMSATDDVFVSLQKHVVAVGLKPGQDIPDDTLKGSLKEAGYDVTAIQRVDAPLAEVRKSVKGK